MLLDLPFSVEGHEEITVDGNEDKSVLSEHKAIKTLVNRYEYPVSEIKKITQVPVSLMYGL